VIIDCYVECHLELCHFVDVNENSWYGTCHLEFVESFRRAEEGMLKIQ
jgi:hypothetical protein